MAKTQRNLSEIIIVGGGFAGLSALHHLKQHLRHKAVIKLVDKNAHSVNRPVMPEIALDGKPIAHSLFPLSQAVGHHAEFVRGEVRSVDVYINQISLKDGRVLKYDFLLLAPGPVHDFGAVAGLEEHGYSVCDGLHAEHLWNAFDNFIGANIVIGTAPTPQGTRVEAPKLVAACEGPVGELMFMVDHHLKKNKMRDDHSIKVFSPGKIFFEDVGPNVREAVGGLMDDAGITVQTGKVISSVGEGVVKFSDGDEWESDFTIVLPPHAPPRFIARSELGDDVGWIPTDYEMQHLDYSNIYAAGDCTALSQPKLGHIAAMQGEIAAKAIIRRLGVKIKVPSYEPEVFCIMNRGGHEATLVLSDTLYGGTRDITVSGALPQMMKWTFDTYVGYTHGHLPPKVSGDVMERLLEHFA